MGEALCKIQIKSYGIKTVLDSEYVKSTIIFSLPQLAQSIKKTL